MNVVKRVLQFFSYWYLRYQLATEMYIIEPWEKAIVHAVFLILFGAVWIFNYTIVLSTISKIRPSLTDWEVTL